MVLLFAFPALAMAAQSGQASPDRPAEYMIYQYPAVALVVKIDAPEVSFTSQVFGPEDSLIMSSGVVSARIGPLYQFVPPAEIPRQLMIKVSPERSISRSRINMELIQLPAADPNSAALAQAYRLLSHGTEQIHANDTTTWAMKAYTLRSAAQAFAGLGWEEMRLLSEFYAAQLVLHKLNDGLLAMEMAREIRQDSRRAGLEWIELAALTLEGDALLSVAKKTDGSLASARYEQVHAVLDQVVLLAYRQGLKSEQARALYNDAFAFRQQDQPEAAIRQLQSALDVALTADDPELVNEIRGMAAATYESLGSTTNAISMLQDIGTGLESDDGEEVTDNLFEKGRLLNESFRYPEAAEELSRALELRREGGSDSGSWGPVGLALAWSWYSMGDWEQAADLYEQSIPRTTRVRNATALFGAYQALATINRVWRDEAQTAEYREKQGELARSDRQRAEFLFDSALDAWEFDGPRSDTARDRLTRSRQAALAAEDSVQAQRATLYLCLLTAGQGRSGSCSGQEVSQAHRALKASGRPRFAVESDFVLARILSREGSARQASETLDVLMDEITFFRQQLPGVLGAWYWQSRAGIFEEYLSASIGAPGAQTVGSSEGVRAMLALQRIRRIEAAERPHSQDSAGVPVSEELRSLVARLESATGQEAESLARQSMQAQDDLAASSGPFTGDLSVASLQAVLDRLGPDSVILSFHLGEPENFVLLGTYKSVSLERLGNATSGIGDRVADLRERIYGGVVTEQQLAALGRSLLGPVANRLARRIYVLPSGALNGFPFSALRVNGEYLAESHDVVGLLNLSEDTRFQTAVAGTFGDRVFLAGNPQSGQQLFSYDLQVSPEISTMTARFVGPGLQIVQGVALQPDEFRDGRITGAGLIHLEMPGTIDLAKPDRSRLSMSGTGGFLRPGGLSGLEFSADLVVLSHVSATGRSPSGFDYRLGFVSEFLEMGANGVLVGFQAGESRESTAFVNTFYDHLETSLDAAEALSRAWRDWLDPGNPSNLGTWAGFQLFIR